MAAAAMSAESWTIAESTAVSPERWTIEHSAESPAPTDHGKADSQRAQQGELATATSLPFFHLEMPP
jgi:hypothetical protein